MSMLRLTILIALMIAGFTVLMLAGHRAHAAADTVPRYDVTPGCRSIARAAEAPQKDSQACIADELGLRDELAREWSAFSAEDKSRCTRRLSGAWRPTYTELATCLEIARAARDLPDHLAPGTVVRPPR
jgi:hypothetical protein